MTEDAELLRRYAAERSESAFAELVHRYLKLVYRAAFRQLAGDAHRAEDATQLVFTLLARKAAALVNHASLAGWLHTTTCYTARNLRRTERRRQLREQEASTMHADDAGAPPETDWTRLRPVLDDALQSLNERDRDAILLRFVDERAYHEVARRLSVTNDAARMRVERALDRLRAALAHRGIHSTAAALAVLLASEAALSAPANLAARVTGAALADAAAGSALLTAKTPSIMNTISLVGIPPAAALLTLGLALHQHRSAQTETDALAALQHEVAALHANLRDAEARRTTLQGELAALAPATTPPAATAASPAELVELEKVRLYFNAEWRKLANHALIFLDRIGASPELATRCAQLADSELGPDRFAKWFGGPHTIDTYRVALQAELDRDLEAILGHEALSRLQRLRHAESAIRPLGEYLEECGLPLQRSQGEALLQFLNAHSEALIEGPVPDSVVLQASGILSADQISAWRRLNSLTELRRQLIEKLRAETAPRT